MFQRSEKQSAGLQSWSQADGTTDSLPCLLTQPEEDAVGTRKRTRTRVKYSQLMIDSEIETRQLSAQARVDWQVGEEVYIQNYRRDWLVKPPQKGVVISIDPLKAAPLDEDGFCLVDEAEEWPMMVRCAHWREVRFNAVETGLRFRAQPGVNNGIIESIETMSLASELPGINNGIIESIETMSPASELGIQETWLAIGIKMDSDEVRALLARGPWIRIWRCMCLVPDLPDTITEDMVVKPLRFRNKVAHTMIFNTYTGSLRTSNGRIEFKEELKRMRDELRIASGCNFATVPIAYAITRLAGLPGQSICTYGFVPLVLSVAYLFQERFMNKVFAALEKIPDEERGKLQVVKNVFLGPAKVLGFTLRWPQWRQTHAEEILEYADPLLDAIMAASASFVLTPEAKEAFRVHSRACMYPLGEIYASLGLEGSLTLMLVVSWFVQAAECHRASQASQRANNDVVNQFGSMTEMASLGLLQNLFVRMKIVEEEELIEGGLAYPTVFFNMALASKFACKVLFENLPSLDLGITMLGLSIHFHTAGPMSIAINFVSILTSIKALWATLAAFSDSLDFFAKGAFQPLIFRTHKLLALLIMTFVVTRLLGTLACPSRSFTVAGLASEAYSRNLTTWGCQEL